MDARGVAAATLWTLADRPQLAEPLSCLPAITYQKLAEIRRQYDSLVSRPVAIPEFSSEGEFLRLVCDGKDVDPREYSGRTLGVSTEVLPISRPNS